MGPAGFPRQTVFAEKLPRTSTGGAVEVGRCGIMRGMKRFLGWCARHAWVVAMGAAFFAISAMTPLMADDYLNIEVFYREAPLAPGQFPTWGTYLGVPDFWGHLLRTTWEHWAGLSTCVSDNTGRFLAAFLLRFVTPMPHWFFVLLNVTMWLLFTWLAWRVTGLSRRWWPAVAAALVVFSLSTEACFWVAGVCNYVWPATLLLALTVLFLRPRLGESVFAWRNAWMAVLLPLGFLAAGGHELFAIPICFGLTVYWLREIVRGRFAINGRLLLTVGFGMGALAVVFSPAIMGRAKEAWRFSTGFDGVWIFPLRWGIAFCRSCGENPLLIGVVVLAAVALLTRRVRLSARAWWLTIFCFFAAVTTVVLTDGAGRNGWVLTVFGTLAAGAMAPSVRWGRVRAWVTPVLAALAVMTFAVTTVMLVRKNREAEAMTADWLASPDGVTRMLTTKAPMGLAWFDRSWPLWILLEWGSGGTYNNDSLARFLGGERWQTLDEQVWENLYLRDLVCRPENRLPNCAGEWYAHPTLDFLVSPMPREGAVACWRLRAKPTYRDVPPFTLWDRLYTKFIDRSERVSFSEVAPGHEMVMNRDLFGCVLETPHGRYVVIRHNHHIPREKLVSIEVIADE